MKKLARIFAAIVATSVGSAHALDPYRMQDQQQRNTRDPETLSRPRTNELKGAEIKEHRDKLNSAKAQIFKQGTAPAGASFRSAPAQEGKPATGYLAEARFDEFTPQVKEQVAKQMGETPRSDQRVAVQVDVGPDAVTVATARLAGAVPSGAEDPASLPAIDLSDITNTISSPRTPAAPTSPAVQNPRQPQVQQPRQARNANTASVAPAGGIRSQIRPPQVSAPRADTPRPAGPPPLSSLPGPVMVRAVAQTLVGPATQVPSASTADTDASASIPSPSGRDLFVRTRSVESGAAVVDVSGRASDIPPTMRARVEAQVGPNVIPARGDTPVTITLSVAPDRTVRVVEARSGATPAVPARAQNQRQAPAVEPARQPAAQVANLSTNNSPEVQASAAAPEQPRSPVAVVNAARAVAAWSGVNPASVRVQAPPETRNAAVSVPVGRDREIRVEAMGQPARGQAPIVRAEGRMGDFAPATRQQVTRALGEFNATALVGPDTPVILEARADSAESAVVTAIAVRLPEVSPVAPVVLWRAADVAPAMAPEAGQEATRGEAASTPDVGQPTATNPSLVAGVQPGPGDTGLAPAVDQLVSNSFDLPTGYDVKPADKQASLKIDPRAANKPDIPVDWRVVPQRGYGFESEAKAVDFTDAIREQIYAKLRDAIENGATWASDAMKGDRQVRVTFEVDQTKKEGNVKVKDVSSTPRDAANDTAQEIGLGEGEFFLVNVGDQSLIVLERGKTASLRVGEGRMKLTSPDGDAKVFVIPNKTKKDTSVVLMLSRESMRANRSAIAKAGGPKAAAALKAAMDGNPDAGEFIVSIDPSEGDDAVTVKAMSAGASAQPIGREKKPEDLQP